ncbi:HAMP domain-containing sensor histidine kinase [uncultured Bacteroides sp.]|uniref:tetratricopeptide repeat-containing sensor histidine kinase n=1 Tax=uncultured Bacteroides sp. TaxID=162156 RepID=UPI0025D935DD|nr:HAMP domain-containing sensor histidine kinase [uncultured Bacteroides sp.]
MKRVKYIAICLLSCAFIGLSLPAKGQDNPYKIDNSLYLLYEKATKSRSLPAGLEIADTLYNKAIRINDKKAQCLALTIPVIYYFNQRQTEELEKSITKLQEISRKNNYLQYYYFGCIYKVNNLMNTGNTLRALQEAESTKEQAFTDNYPYGISTCLRMMGNIYYARGETRTALDYYQQALKYTQENLPEQDLAHLYCNISMLQQILKQIEPAYENAEKGIKCAKTAVNKYACMLRKCMLLYMLNRTEEFESYYQECQKMTEKYGKTRKNELNKLKIYYYILHKQYKEAHQLADSATVERDRIAYHVEIYAKERKYKEAYESLQKFQILKDSINQLIQYADLSELNVRIGNEQLKRKAQALQLENTQLTLQTTTLELEQAKSQVEIEKMNSENNQLQLKNRSLELAQFKAEAERKQSLMRAKQAESDHQLMILKFVLTFFCFFAAALTYYVYLRRKSVRQLQEKNEELTIARDHAEQADKMKTYFIQNMSHEIRTPLNAIVGFSQILSDPDMPLDNEEKKEFSFLVQHNSELLTTLVNDILDLSALESGKYTMNMASHRCNEMCEMILSTVTHRKPEVVKLYYTSDIPDDFQIITDQQRLQQVLINFLTNAEKYTEEGEIRLHCSITENPGKITFSVTDTGSGIPADKMDSIFERFKKLDEFKQGSGLGLNICRIIAERLHGEVKVDKSYTGGARFLFILPLQ